MHGVVDGVGMLKRFSGWLIGYLFNGKRSRPAAFLFLFLILISPVVLMAVMSYLRTERDLTEAVFARRETIAYLAAAIVKEKLDRITDLGISLATRVRFRQLVAATKWDE